MDDMNTTDSTGPGVPPGTDPRHGPQHDGYQHDGPQHGGRQHDGRQHGTGFFDTIRGFGVTRTQERWVGGVCGGLARRFGVDPLLIRAGLIVLLILGIGFLAYLIAWALLPDENGSILAEKGIRDGDGGGIFILIVIGLAVFGLGPWFGNNSWAGPVVLSFAALLGWYVYSQRKKSGGGSTASAPSSSDPGAPHTAHGPTAPHFGSTEPRPAWSGGQTASAGYEPPPSEEYARAAYQAPPADQSGSGSRPKAKRAGLAGFLLVLGIAILGFGIGQAVGGSTLAALLAATGAAGLATVLLGILGRRSALSSLLSLGLALSLVTTWGAAHVPQGGFGEAIWQPQNAGSQHTYSWAMGSATLDLSDYDADEGQPITASVSFGELVIQVPEDVTTRVDASVNFGNITLQGTGSSTARADLSGTNVSRDLVFGEGEPQITVQASARFGSIRIVTPTDPTQTEGL